MRHFFRFTLIAAFILLIPVLLISRTATFQDRPAITYFPATGSITFNQAETRLKQENNRVNWSVGSSVNRRVYLLQDFSILYKNNRLIAIINHWERNRISLFKSRSVKIDPGFYESLSMHQAEVHEDDLIYGKITRSADRIYAGQIGGKLYTFKQARSKREIKLRQSYHNKINKEQSDLLAEAVKQYGIAREKYHVFPLSELFSKSSDEVFPSSGEGAQRISGQLMEGIYTTMVRGIQTPDGRLQSPVGSLMPLLLIGPDHLLVVIQTSNYQIALLRQQF
ncbi:hypothetical protein ABNN70_12705 [Sporolactobacillus sp. Y61]|uniref:Uncharacterized protein n=1 Tax=Sporolactobacillus sp. Y61 TaxID=3160863 RepID=A0AAU8IE68_9BACL